MLLQHKIMDAQLGMSRNTGPGLYEFLMEAELQQYYSGIRGDLKVHNPAQLKYVTEDDLGGIGMTKPEMRRLKKYFQRHFPQNYLSKFKKMLLPRKDDAQQLAGALGQGLPEERQDRPPVRVPNKHMIPADAIIVNKELGTGEFGVVQQGVWTNDGERIQVAIKCLSRERMQNNPIEFLKEAAIMHSIDHEHIVRLYGVVLDTSSLMLVTELAPLRSLLECLKEPQLRSSFPVPSLCDFAVQIADGMQYLEAKRLIHRDLAARNILVFSKNKVKISDFGLSRALGVGKDYYQTNFNVNLKLPIAWCAPECISYLKFTSASDVWAYGVTLWEMFSYGFQPWAALTGHQILEAIDEPNYQRLEQPDCCPKDYFNLMQKCWQHEPTKRPKFSEIIALLPDLKPEQVQAVQDTNEIGMLVYKQNDVITVLDKGCSNTMWKGVLANGKTGFFNPAHTIAYLGGNLPSNVKPGEFQRGGGGGTDGKNGGIFSSQRRKIRTDMISSPQGDLKHTGHVGLDGAYFGDLSFLGGKYPHLPRQVVTPYKPQEDATDNNSSHHHHQHHHHEAGGSTLRERTNGDGSHNNRDSSIRDSRSLQHNSLWSDSCSEISQMGSVNTINNMPANMVSSTDSSTICGDHEYHEISDEENQESPLRFDKPLSFDFGPSLMDEMDQMFRSLDSLNLGASPNPPPAPAGLQQQQSSIEQHESSNARNELREIQSKQTGKRKQATVKPISAADQKTLYSAIAMAQEITARSMTDLETQHHQEVGGGGNNANNGGGGGAGGAAGSAGSISGSSSSQQHARHGGHCQGGGSGSGHSPRTPSSPTTTHRRKFSFKLPHQHSPKPDRRHFSEEAASIPDIQATLSEEAKEVYNSLVETPVTTVITETPDTNPLRMLRSGFPVVRPRVRGNKHVTTTTTSHHDSDLHTQGSSRSFHFDSAQRHSSGACTLPKLKIPVAHPSQAPPPIPSAVLLRHRSMEIENNQNQSNTCNNSGDENPIPLPPRDRSKSLQPKSSLPRHQRKHPLIIPGDGVSRTLAKMQAASNAAMEDQVDGGCVRIGTESSSSLDIMLGNELNANTDEFERRIDSDITALDSLLGCDEAPTTTRTNSQQQRCSVISEDLLEFSENLIDCGGDDESEDDDVDGGSVTPVPEQQQNQLSRHSSADTATDTSRNTTPTNKLPSETQQQIIDLKGESMTRTSDHVSCEDLLEFACDKPNSRRTRGPRNGEQSDEVRIMLKILHDQSTPESCMAALNVTNWEILAAIKLERLQGLLRKENHFVSLEDCKTMLNQCGGDVVKAAALLRNTDDTAAV
ncbi:tyrosine-protein kinase PR2 isoform X7 [Trichogramma pretiosum]|uniref:tyrosine-protein kinase PR2 isoform X7 n=1 Tax=Trichogramma pretiosum TaxID=7493 RepID=UPI0006C95CE8|nr:tyrosine-protein kinase PR2 isoform X7 [Trichogramma pretiosum]